jgi:hypothetical protein
MYQLRDGVNVSTAGSLRDLFLDFGPSDARGISESNRADRKQNRIVAQTSDGLAFPLLLTLAWRCRSSQYDLLYHSYVG